MEYIVGSKCLGLENVRDIDVIVFTDDIEYKKESKDGKDIVYTTIERYNTILNFEDPTGYRRFLMMTNYQKDREIIGKDFPIEYNILDHKEELIALIVESILQSEFNFNKRVTVNGGMCSKQIYHVAYNIFILKNNSPIITVEQKAVIQKIHDCQMPIDYLDELLNILMEVLKNEWLFTIN